MTVPRPARLLLSLLLALVIISAPLTLHWWLWERPYSNLYHEFTAFIIYVSDVLTAVFVLATAVWLVIRRQPLQFGPPALTIPLLLLPLLALLSSHWAFDPALAAHFATRLFILFSFYLAILNLQPTRPIIYAGLAAVLLVQGITAVLQFQQQHNLGLTWLGEIPIIATSGFSLLSANGTQWLRGYGLAPHPNILGGILAALLLPMTAVFLGENGRRRWLWAAAILAGLAGLFVTFSRAAWLGIVVAGLIFLARLLRQSDTRHYTRLIWPLALISFLLLAGFMGTQRQLLLSRFAQTGNPQEIRSINERRTLNEITMRAIAEHPWRGLGAGQLSYYIDEITITVPGVQAQPAHNMPLLLTAELGLLGGGVWLWLMAAPLVIAWQRRSHFTLWAWSLTAALLIFAITDLFDFYSWNWPQGRLMRWLLFGLWAEAIFQQRNSDIIT